MEVGVIGVDVGGTKMTAGLYREEIVKLLRVQVDRGAGAEGGFKVICDMLVDLFNEARLRGFSVERIGVGFGGPVDFESGVVYLSHHVRGWENFPLRDELERRFGVSVVVDNDANAGALGEWVFGAGRGIDDLIYVNIGTGIGSGVISGGRLVRGWRNLAGEIGHMTVKLDGPVCSCGRRGCLESLASGSAIGREGSERFGRAMRSEEIFELALEGNAIARQILFEVIDSLAFAIGAAVNLFNPRKVILGGGVAEVSESLLVEPFRERLSYYTLREVYEGLEVVRAELGYDAGVMGAIALAIVMF